jgi:hypothetical protein
MYLIVWDAHLREVFIMAVTLRVETVMLPTANNHHFVGQSATEYKLPELLEAYTN